MTKRLSEKDDLKQDSRAGLWASSGGLKRVDILLPQEEGRNATGRTLYAWTYDWAHSLTAKVGKILVALVV